MSVLPDDRAANLAIFGVVWMAVISWQLITAHTDRLPSFVSVVGLAKRWRTARWALLAGWAWLGWHLFVRTTY